MGSGGTVTWIGSMDAVGDLMFVWNDCNVGIERC